MSEEKLITVREVAVILGVSEKDVLDLTEAGTLPAYKIGGVYLRFKKEQVEQYKKERGQLQIKTKAEPLGISNSVGDFFYFNDFYIFAAVSIILLVYFLYRGL